MAPSSRRPSPAAPRHARRILLALFVLPLVALSAGRLAAPLADAAAVLASDPGAPPASLQPGQPGLGLS